MFKKQRLHVDARYALFLKKLTSLKVKQNCDKIMLNFCAGIRQHSTSKKNLLILFIFLDAQTHTGGDIPVRTLHQKWSQLFYVSNQKSKNSQRTTCVQENFVLN